MRKPRLAFVVQRYGPDVVGGAESLCRLLAEHLRGDFDIEVLTTCARDHVTWRDHYKPGGTKVNGVKVRRFRVDFERNILEFHEVSRSVLGGRHSAADEEMWMKAQGPFSTGLINYVMKHAGAYDVFGFMTYLYATTFYPLPHVARKAVLIPTAHDERPIYLSLFDHVFGWPRRLVCCTQEEVRFIEKRFGIPPGRMTVVGGGIDIRGVSEHDPAWATFRDRLPRDAARAIYVGRLEGAKGGPMMLEYFVRYRRSHPEHDLQLLLVGRGDLEVPELPCIHRTGFVSNAFKHAAIRDSDVMIIPSAYESLSLVALEAWREGRPVLVNGQSEVLKGHCRRGCGGLWYESYEEFREGLAWLLDHPAEAGAMGRQGRRYARENYSWPVVRNRFRKGVQLVLDKS